MRLYWWNTEPNLGDELSRVLLSRHYDVEWAPPKDAEWVGIGSVLGWFNGFTGVVWGSGRSGDLQPPIDLTHADVRALRGTLTRGLVKGGDDAVLGDPGLLAPDLFETVPEPTGIEVIVPHLQDRGRMRASYPAAIFADVTKPVLALALIAFADRVVSSSLHGLVLADAFGRPRKWEWFDGVQSKGFKFRDYFSVVGESEPGEWFTADASRIAEIQEGLRGCLT